MNTKYKVEDAIKKQYAYATIKYKVEKSVLEIYVHNEGDCVENFNLETLMEMVNIFGTKKINTEEYARSNGCDSCGHGSFREQVLLVSEMTDGLDLYNAVITNKL